MLKVILPVFLATGLAVFAAEEHAAKHFDFTKLPVGSTPSNFVSSITGNGAPGTWKIIEHDGKRALTQMDLDTTDEHFPVLLYDGETFSDFTATVHFKLVGGEKDQRGGLVFRAQDESSYYCMSVSSLGNNAKFVSFVGGLHGKLFGKNLNVTRDQWHALSIQCEGNRIYSFLDGTELIPMITDTKFIKGKVGLWTKSDSQVLFSDLHIDYTPHLPFAQALVKDIMEQFPKKRLVSIKMYAPQSSDKPRVIAASDPKFMNEEGGDYEIKTLKGANGFFTKTKGLIEITLPLRDRNGDIAAVVKFALKPFPGETQDAAWGRCKPIQAAMEERMQGMTSLTE